MNVSFEQIGGSLVIQLVATTEEDKRYLNKIAKTDEFKVILPPANKPELDGTQVALVRKGD